MKKAISVLGLCGREGSGKTTVANMLTGGPKYELRKINDPLTYMTDVLFGDNNPWGYSTEDQRDLLKLIIETNVDSKWFEKHPSGEYMAPFDIVSDKEWVEFSMATPLKKVCSILFDIDYDILLAQTPEARVIRENMSCRHDYDKLPEGLFNGRVCLEYFGTDVMRNKFDRDIWMKILKRDATRAIDNDKRVVIPDVRFENEIDLISKLDGTLFVIYRSAGELILTEDDEKTHPAKWNFLKYYTNSKNYEIIGNNGSIDDLQKSLHTRV